MPDPSNLGNKGTQYDGAVSTDEVSLETKDVYEVVGKAQPNLLSSKQRNLDEINKQTVDAKREPSKFSQQQQRHSGTLDTLNVPCSESSLKSKTKHDEDPSTDSPNSDTGISQDVLTTEARLERHNESFNNTNEYDSKLLAQSSREKLEDLSRACSGDQTPSTPQTLHKNTIANTDGTSVVRDQTIDKAQSSDSTLGNHPVLNTGPDLVKRSEIVNAAETLNSTSNEAQDIEIPSPKIDAMVIEAETVNSGKTVKMWPTLEALHLESDSDYGPLLSVINEVDEDNLTDSNNNSHRMSENTRSENEATLSNKQLNSLPTDSPSCSETATSDDGGFRTEDDVLDLLDDDIDIINDSRGHEGTSGIIRGNARDMSRGNTSHGVCNSGVKNDQNVGTHQEREGLHTLDNVGDRMTCGHKPLNSNITVDGSDKLLLNQNHSKITGDKGCEEDKSAGIIETKPASLIQPETGYYDTDGSAGHNNSQSETDSAGFNLKSCLNNGGIVPDTTCEPGYNNDNDTTDSSSTENRSESSYHHRTSFQSDISVSDDPPEAELAFQTIIAALSLPSDRTMMSGESAFRNRRGSESELSDNTSENVRYFVALYSYDPQSMSPNEDGADEELPFSEGDIIKVGFISAQLRSYRCTG